MTAVTPRGAGHQSFGRAGTPSPAAAPIRLLPLWRKRLFWIVFVGYWTGFGLLFTGTHYARSRLMGLGDGLSVPVAMAASFADTFFLAVLCLIAFGLAWGFPMDVPRHRKRNVAMAILAAPIVTTVVQLGMTTSTSAIVGVRVPPLRVLLLLSSPVQLLTYTCFLGLGYAIRYFVRSRESSIAAARLESELARAELELARANLQVLKMQLDPHFLFNTFNAVTALMYRDVKQADRTLRRLSELLQLTLAHSGDEEVPLAEELHFLRIYLDIQETRFERQLVVHWEVEEEAASACVPHLILQPIVENAIVHGTAVLPGTGQIWIRAHAEGETLVLSVRDSGPGLPEKWEPRPGGVGLSVTQARLEQMYGERHSIELRTADEGGALVRIQLPLRHDSPDRPAAGGRSGRRIIPE